MDLTEAEDIIFQVIIDLLPCFFQKIRHTKGTFHAKMGSIKDKNGTDLTEEEDIKKRLQEYRELYIKHLHDPDNHDGVIAHLEPDILEFGKSGGP